MKVLRFLAVSAVCVALALSMMVHSFAQTLVTASTQWGDASLTATMGGASLSLNGLSAYTSTNPPSSPASDYSGYYTNNWMATDVSRSGTATTAITGIEYRINFPLLLQPGDYFEFYLYSSLAFSVGGTNYYPVLSSFSGYTDNYTYFSAPASGNNNRIYYTNNTDEPIYFSQLVLRASINTNSATGTFNLRSILRFSDLIYVSSDPTKVTTASDAWSDLTVKVSVGDSYGTTATWLSYEDSMYPPSALESGYYNAGYYSRNMAGVLFSAGSNVSTSVATTIVMLNLPKTFTLAPGERLEFYMYVNLSITNQGSTYSINASRLNSITAFQESSSGSGAYYANYLTSNYWALIWFENSTDDDITFSTINASFTTPSTIVGQYYSDYSIRFSDIVYGEPTVDPNPPETEPPTTEAPETDPIETIGPALDNIQGELGDINDKLDNINGWLTDDRDIEADFGDVTAADGVDIGGMIGEDEAIQNFEQIVADAEAIIGDASFASSGAWWQEVFTEIMSWSVIGLMAALCSSLIIVRAFLGR